LSVFMAEGQSGAFGTQFAYLLFLVLRLKSWKFLLWILLGPSLFFNFFLYRNIEDKEEGGVKSNGLTELKMSVAMAHGALVPTSSREKKSLIEIMQLRKAKSRSWFKDCKDINDCRIQLAKAVSAKSSEKTSIFIYGKNKTIRLYCLKDKNAEILCPFLYHAMSQSLESYEYARAKSSKAQTALYKDIMFAKFFDKFGSSSDGVGLNISKPDSMCTRTSKSGTFFIKFIMYFMGHMIIVLASFILYTTVGSLSSMSNLKENGFLQLVFNNGLSVTVYWLVYWTIGAIEALIPATLLVMSYSFQCPGYYESSGLTNFFITVAAMFFFLTALGYLFATLIASFFIVLLLMIVIQIVCCGVIIMAKLWIFQKKPLSTINTFLAFPPGTVYQGQITALIGHNGAGKTTLIRVLMGEEIPSRGVAVINGHRVTDPYQRLALRGSVSICKQVDVLSNYLTVMESMKLTLVAKGFSPDSQVAKVLDMMKRLGLAGKENVQAMDLSGGQMRKVCSIICLLGNPKLVILDEPTSGLDPVSRRNLWQILQDHKAGRSIILCTQFMDEADILADRKVFLSAGKIICAGSSMFLKHAFGCCVSINVTLKHEKDATKVVKMLKKVKLVGSYQTELQLQVSAGKPQALADAIYTLEQHPELVDAFGVSQAQLDDIFMRLKFIDLDNIEASFKSKQLRKLGRSGGGGSAGVERVNFSSLYNFESTKPLNATFANQFLALIRMNFSRQLKAKMTFCFRIIFPLIMIGIIAQMCYLENKDKEKKPGKDKDKEQNAAEQPSVAIINMNSSDMRNSLAISRGVCIADKESGVTNTTLTRLCGMALNSRYLEVAIKDMKTSVGKFVQTPEVKKKFRKICPKSSKNFVINCFFVYSTDWNSHSNNSRRLLYHGVYENPVDEEDESAREKGVFAAMQYYDFAAEYFEANAKSKSRNFTLASVYLAETIDSFKFEKCQELFMLLAAFALVPVTYLNDPIEDKDSGVRQHLASMGMSSIAYWFTTFVMHWLHYILCFFSMALTCLMVEKYQSAYFLVYMVLPLTFLGTSCSQLTVYVVSAMMKKTNAIVLVLYFFFAMFLGMAGSYFQDNESVLYAMMIIIPPFPPLLVMLMGTKMLLYTILLFETSNPADVPNIRDVLFANSHVVYSFIVMPIHIAILIGLIFIIENPGALASLFAKNIEASKQTPKPLKDEGVGIEANRIRKTTRSSVNMLEVRDLQKVYPNGVHAVRGTTFGSFSGEILGLLGPNGAGKTTSMSIIVGEEASSSGTSEVHFGGTWMSGIDGARCGAIGYCPQHNPLFNSISVFEHLRFYAQIRGIPDQLGSAQIAGLIEGLGLKPHQHKAAEQLSGGNKRRLCLAIALLGNPSLVVIDEASTGVDPENKRFIWGAIRGMANKQRSVMITTHSMEEVEALCARVGIMNKGLMIGFGTVQQLRSRHGEAYTLDVLMKSKKPQKLALKRSKLAKRIIKQFPESVVMEDLERSMQFSLLKKSVPKFSEAMRWLIAKKKKLGIQYFSLYQMSLDQVFVKLVKEYDES
uniref:ABC transporter domain-containing protein n=2 Tax=Macrostomum lignano TaxID=282301 RepID=A0A1I8FXV0_9PLAT